MSCEDIQDSMARTLWISAYASYADENPRKRGIVRARGGDDWMRIAPDTPPAAHRAAAELGELFVAKNRGNTLNQLAIRAGEADGSLVDDEDFGHYLAMMAMGEGVSWFDDHERFDIEVPHFEIHFDGRHLDWSGETVTVQRSLPGVNPSPNPSRDLGGSGDVEKLKKKWKSGWTLMRGSITRKPPRIVNPEAPKLGGKYVLGSYAPGSRVQLGEWKRPSLKGFFPGSQMLPGEWVTVVRNGAGHTVTVKIERTGATVEKDALAPLVEVDVLRSSRA